MSIPLIKLVLELFQVHIIVPTIKKFKQHGFDNRGQTQTRGCFGGHECRGGMGIAQDVSQPQRWQELLAEL